MVSKTPTGKTILQKVIFIKPIYLLKWILNFDFATNFATNSSQNMNLDGFIQFFYELATIRRDS